MFESTAFSAVIRVKPGGNDASSGASWALAKATVQAAIDAAAEGDEIWVAAGTYPQKLKNKVLDEDIKGVAGTCEGTSTWSVAGVLLFPGQNVITVTAHDRVQGGNAGSAVITVAYLEPLMITGYVRTPGGSGIGGAGMSGLPSNPITDVTGNYSDLAVPAGQSGTGSFTSLITGLIPGLTYHVRAYATNSAGTSYGDNVTFTTQSRDYFVPLGEASGNSSWLADWTVQVEGAGVGNQQLVGLSAEAGGSPNELRTRYQPAFGTMRLVTPPVDTMGRSALVLSFRHFLRSWDTGGVMLRVQTSPDGVSWADESWSVVTTAADIGPAVVGTSLTQTLGRKTTHVAFVIQGDLFHFEDWFIDDVSMGSKGDLLGTWDVQGVYYRDSMTGAWVKMASPATLITAGDIDGDATDDLIGIWPTQGGVWVKYSLDGTWERLSSGRLRGRPRVGPAQGRPLHGRPR